MQKNIYFFIGTTAELIKLAPVIRELKKRKVDFKIIASNQNVLHFDELKSLIGKQYVDYKIVSKPIKFPPNVYFRFTIWVIKSLINSFLYFNNEFRDINKKNSFFIVHGDTVSSLIGAIAARFAGIKIVHIESGLRSFNFFEPFPEELCRFIVSHLANVHFCPNSWAVNNLKNNKRMKINTYNNTLIESLFIILKTKRPSINTKLPPNKKHFLLVLHRQEHMLFKKNLTTNYLKQLTEYANEDLICVLVLHKLTERFIKRQGLFSKFRKNKNIILVPRLPYNEFIQLMQKAEFIATDGGSNQEEAYYMGKPCIILRNVTERIEGLGENAVLAKEVDHNIIRNFVENYKKYRRRSPKISISPSKIIVDYIMESKLLS